MIVEPGTKLGRLEVTSRAFGKDVNGVRRLFHICKCSCGVVREFSRDSLMSGRSNSCGCLRSEEISKRSATHGKSKSPIYAVWNMMMQRCYLPSNKQYPEYGGRGIDVHPDWHTFQPFYAYVGDPPFKGASLDRVDNDKGYCPGNVRWATRTEQNRNKRNNKLYLFEGKEMLLIDWAKHLNINYKTLTSRIYLYKWDVEKAFTTPVKSIE